LQLRTGVLFSFGRSKTGRCRFAWLRAPTPCLTRWSVHPLFLRSAPRTSFWEFDRRSHRLISPAMVAHRRMRPLGIVVNLASRVSKQRPRAPRMRELLRIGTRARVIETYLGLRAKTGHKRPAVIGL